MLSCGSQVSFLSGSSDERGSSVAPNMRMKLSCRSGHTWRNELFLIVAAPARSLCAIR
jgi:hypothetical protein